MKIDFREFDHIQSDCSISLYSYTLLLTFFRIIKNTSEWLDTFS